MVRISLAATLIGYSELKINLKKMSVQSNLYKILFYMLHSDHC